MAKSNLHKRNVKPTSCDEDFGKKQLFMHRQKDKDMIILSSGEHNNDGTFKGTVVHCSEQMNVGVIGTFLKNSYVPVNGEFKITLK